MVMADHESDAASAPDLRLHRAQGTPGASEVPSPEATASQDHSAAWYTIRFGDLGGDRAVPRVTLGDRGADVPAVAGQGGTEVIIRTYEVFDVAYRDGATVTGFGTKDEADGWLATGNRRGEVKRRTFEVEIDPAHARLYQPGISERRGFRSASTDSPADAAAEITRTIREPGGTERTLTFRVGDKVRPADADAMLRYDRNYHLGVTHGEVTGIQPGLVNALTVRWVDDHGPYRRAIGLDPAKVRPLGETPARERPVGQHSAGPVPPSVADVTTFPLPAAGRTAASSQRPKAARGTTVQSPSVTPGSAG